MKISINIIWQSKCHCGCSPRCISFVLIYSGELKRQRDCDCMDENILALECSSDNCCRKMPSQISDFDQRKITHSVIMPDEMNTFVPKTLIPKEWQVLMTIHGPVTDIMMFFWIIVHLIHICMSCWFIKYDSWCDSIIINQCTILINDACMFSYNKQFEIGFQQGSSLVEW